MTMVPVKVFLTGATGYIGGDVLYLLKKRHPAWLVSCLVRDRIKASIVTSRYPHVRVVLGSLDSAELIEEECADANLIYHCANCDHTRSAHAIARGVRRNPLPAVYWIHTSGAGILTHQNFALNLFDTVSPEGKVYDDWDGVDELTSLPDKALHRHVDKIVLSASFDHKHHVKTAIVCPPAIYGLGRGTGNTRSVQVNVAVRLALQNGKAFRMGDGSNIWHGVHIHDLSQLYIMLGEAAVSGDPKATWNDTGYYLAEDGPFQWGDIVQSIANEARDMGYLATNKVEGVSFDCGQQLHRHFPYLCGTTSKGISKRARILLGWKPREKSLREELPLIVRDEVASLKVKTQTKGLL